jgi:hypothetical protein
MPGQAGIADPPFGPVPRRAIKVGNNKLLWQIQFNTVWREACCTNLRAKRS